MKNLVWSTVCLGLVLTASGRTPAAGQAGADPVAEARAMAVSGRLAEAQKHLKTYIAAHPSSAEAHFLLGYVLFRMEKPKESLAEFTAGAAYRRPDANDLKVVASDYVLLKDFADADKWFTAVVTEQPLDADGWYLLGRTQYNEEEFAKSIKSFRRALTLRPRYLEAENNLGLALSEANQKAAAQQIFETAIEWQGETPRDAQPFLNLGTLLVESHDNEKALPYLQKAVALAPDNPKAHEELGKAYTATGKLEQAQSELEEAVKLVPESSSLHYKLGQMYRRRGFADLAQKEFNTCEQLNSTHSSTETPNPPK